jgi:hypothetical protein
MNTLHLQRNVRRLALVSGAVIALCGLAGAPATQAVTPPVLSQMAQALARVRAYQVTMQSASAGYGSPLSVASAGTVVGQGKTLRLYVTTTMERAGQVSTLEEVLTGAHLCLRSGGQRAWSCSAAPSGTLTRLQSTDPAQMAKALGLSQRYVAAGRQIKQGQSCLGYRFSFTTSGLHGQGTLWIARATSLPVEEDTVSALALRPGAPPLVVRTTQRWSRWNDPHLTIPSVPAS